MTFFLIWLLLAVGLGLGTRGFIRLRASERFQQYWSLQSRWAKLFTISVVFCTTVVVLGLLTIIPFVALTTYTLSLPILGLYFMWTIVAISAAKAAIAKMADFVVSFHRNSPGTLPPARGDLRDHFAGLAMHAELTRRGSPDRDGEARRAYAMADAMLAARHIEESDEASEGTNSDDGS